MKIFLFLSLWALCLFHSQSGQAGWGSEQVGGRGKASLSETLSIPAAQGAGPSSGTSHPQILLHTLCPAAIPEPPSTRGLVGARPESRRLGTRACPRPLGDLFVQLRFSANAPRQEGVRGVVRPLRASVCSSGNRGGRSPSRAGGKISGDACRKSCVGARCKASAQVTSSACLSGETGINTHPGTLRWSRE